MVSLNSKEAQPDEKELPADATDRNAWPAKEAGERINDYSSCSKRLEFYERNALACEVSERNGVSYFRALKNEEQCRKDVKTLLSMELRVAIANFVNFNSTRKVSTLVNRVFQRFRNRFFEGEIVCLKNNQRKVLLLPKLKKCDLGGVQDAPSYNTLFVVRDVFQSNEVVESGTEEILASDLSLYLITGYARPKSKGIALIASQNEIERPACQFSKFVIACFLNEIIIKVSNKQYALWRVKQQYVEKYNVDSKCPPEIFKYLSDEKDAASREPYTPSTIPPEEDIEPTDWEEWPPSKIQKVSNEISANFDPIHTAKFTGYNSSKRIVNDKELPFTGPSTPFKSTCYLDSFLEFKTIDLQWYEECAQLSTERLLVVYRFLNSFGPFIGLEHFNFDQFLTTIKCTDPEVLLDEYVKINIVNVDHKEDTARYGELQTDSYGPSGINKVSQRKGTKIPNLNGGCSIPSNFTRNQGIRKLITNKSTEFLKYSIFKSEPPKNESMDAYPFKKASDLYIDIACSLLSLITNEKGNWTCDVMGDWIGEERKEEEGKFFDGKIIEKCLSYGNTRSPKLSSSKNLRKENWLICFLGILKQNMHIIRYSDVAESLTEKLLPSAMNSHDLGEELWQNFCRKLSKKAKIDILWILVDLISNFSSYIKELVDGAPQLCNKIRLELDNVKKKYHELKKQLKILSEEYVQLCNTPAINKCKLDVCENKINGYKLKMKYLREDTNYLEAKLLQSDIKRLETLGKDRYGNRYYWMDSNGSPSPVNQKDELHYNCCYLWVQGPSEEDVNFYLDVDQASLRKWKSSAKVNGTVHASKEVFSIYRSADGSYFRKFQGEDIKIIDSNGILVQSTPLAPIHRKIIAETPEKLLLSSHQWFFMNDVEDIHMLVDKLDNLAENERQLKKALTHRMHRIEASYEQQLKAKRRVEFDSALKTYLKLWKANEFTSSDLQRIGAMDISNDERVTSIVKLAKELSREDNDVVTEKILKDAVLLGECERVLLEKQQSLLYSLDFHFEQLRTVDHRLVLEMKKKKQEEVLTKLLNHQRYRYISSTSELGTKSQWAKEATYLSVQGMLEEIKRHINLRHKETPKDY
ncbi:hypothetical protein SKDZ_16G0620 [Saccharomyces kudriavzevii ZP591]|nr:hypothetical protein SKDZ_16G0620 [Saccharomyces kudriavzevii ZP591]